MPEADATELPPAQLRRRLRRSWIIGGGILAAAVALAVWGFAEWRQERVLDDGPRVQAEVVDIDFRRRLPDLVEVRYEVDGRRYQERLPAEISGLEPGDRIEIIYDPAEPSHARPVEGWTPSYEYVWLVALVLAPVAIGLAGYDQYLARASVRAVKRGTTRRMWVRGYRRWSWAHRGHQHLAALWGSESEPPDGRPPDLVVEVTSGEAKHLRDGPVTAHGDLVPGGRMVLRADGRTIWPRGPNKAELPTGAKPV